jgi:hypothetical protein
MTTRQQIVFFLVVFGFFFLFSCEGGRASTKADKVSQAPAWVNSPKKDSSYYYVVGYSEDVGPAESVQQKALQNAKGKIANVIFEEAEVEKVLESSGNLSGNEEISKNYRESIKSKSSVNLLGVETEDVYQEKSNDGGLDVYKIWVLAKISTKNLEKERTRILSEIKRKLALVDDNLNQAKGFAAEGKAIDAVNAYLKAAVSSTKVKERAEEFPIYISEAGKILEKMLIEAGENPPSADIGKGANFNFQIFYSGEKGKVPVGGAGINFSVRNNEGDYTKAAVSGENGVVLCKIKKLKQVRNDNTLYAKLALDFPEILNIGKDYQKYYSTLKDYVMKIAAASDFKTASAENRSIVNSVIAVLKTEGEQKLLPGLASEALSALISKGYKAVRFSDSLSLDDLTEGKQSALNVLLTKGIKRVLVLSVSIQEKPKYNETLGRYMGVYSISAQWLDTENGEILSAKNIKQNATASEESGVFDAFIKAASSQIAKMIE